MGKAYIVLVLAILLAAWRLQTPAPVPADAPASVFSAMRAFGDISAIAQRPHPVGTADHDRVRAYLVGRLTAMGLAPQQQTERSTRTFSGRTISAPVTNIAAILEGKDRSKPAVLVMSHYDSVPDSPGAADDTAGVAATLEIARALISDPQPDRDVIFLFTDGEELGLMGATAFFHHNPLAAHVGAVINFEARGDSGLAAMFETGPKNADAVALYVAKAPRPSANSLARAIYRNMPNGSDFSLALERGLPGLNFAFIGDEAAYHTPLATPAHLNLGSVQHMGDQALAATRAFAATMPQQKADAVYSDILGFFVIQYSFAVGWILFAVTAIVVIYVLWAASEVASASWWRGLGATLCVIALPTVILGLAGYTFNGTNHFLRLAHFDYLLAGAAALAIGSILLIAALFARRRIRPGALWQTMLLFQLLMAGLAQAFVPDVAFVLVWPLLAAGLVAAVRFGLYRGEERLPSVLFAAFVALLVLAQTACAAASLFTAVGADMPVVMMLALLPAIPLLLLLLPEGRRPYPLWPHTVVIIAGVALFAYGRFAPPTAERPQPSLVRHVQDLDSGKAWRVAYLNALDPWTKTALGSPRQEALPWSEGYKFWLAPTKAAAVPSSNLTIERVGPQLRITVKTAPGAYSAVLSLRASEPLPAGTLDGEKTVPLKAGAWHDVHYYSPEGFTWVVDAPRRGTVEAKLNTIYLEWPNGAAKLPPMPASQMAFGISNSTETVTRRTWRP